MKNTIDMNLLLYLNVLLEEQNISRAAKRLCISQPALSNALSRMREAFGDDILTRSQGNMVPTPFATHIRLALREALEKIDSEVLHKREFDPRTDSYQFNLSFYGYEESVILPALWQELEQFPKLVLSNRAPNRLQIFDSLRLLQVHFTTMTMEKSSADFCTRRLLSDDFVAVTHKDFAPPMLDSSTYFSHHHVIASPVGEQSMVDNLIAPLGQSRRVIARLSEFSSIPMMLCADKNAISTIPKKLADIWLRHFPLRIMPLPFAIAPLKVFLSWHKSAENIPALDWFKQKLIAVAKNI